MPRKRKRVRKPILENPAEIKIEGFISSLLTLSGLRKNKDFKIANYQLFIYKHPIRGKLISILKELYPQYNFYWETARLLRWF